MIYLPPLRRLLLPAIVFLVFVIFYRANLRVPRALPSFVLHTPPTPLEGIRVAIADLQLDLLTNFNTSNNHHSPPSKFYYSYYQGIRNSSSTDISSQPINNPAFQILWQCPIKPNRFTNHIRLPSIIRNITQIPPKPIDLETRVFWNPTIMSLPPWSENQYLVVSRILTEGNHQENVMCEANICYTGSDESAVRGEKPCTQDDLKLLGPAGGMRCVEKPINLKVPPTPAEHCEGKFATYVDIPGFHDPRIFWSGKGEPLMMLLTSSPDRPSLGPLKSYQTLTELTRNPPKSRALIEKNWMLFFTSSGESYVHYDLSKPKGGDHGRTFAKIVGNGFTTPNLTDPLELSCLDDTDSVETDKAKRGGTWHQASNSLSLVLCERKDPDCHPSAENTVFFAVIHRKFPNYLELPLRYERHFMVWSAVPPFSMLGISQHPVLLANETASGWTASENWDDDPNNAATVYNTRMRTNTTEPYGGKGFWAYFTYTVSIGYAWGRADKEEVDDKNIGFLDDEVILGIGVDDKGQGFAKVRAGDMVRCLKACPGRVAEETKWRDSS
ncbi:MAG: hypothetical protein Q9167_000927 [Letrouitia subvulpina]